MKKTRKIKKKVGGQGLGLEHSFNYTLSYFRYDQPNVPMLEFIRIENNGNIEYKLKLPNRNNEYNLFYSSISITPQPPPESNIQFIKENLYDLYYTSILKLRQGTIYTITINVNNDHSSMGILTITIRSPPPAPLPSITYFNSEFKDISGSKHRYRLSWKTLNAYGEPDVLLRRRDSGGVFTVILPVSQNEISSPNNAYIEYLLDPSKLYLFGIVLFDANNIRRAITYNLDTTPRPAPRPAAITARSAPNQPRIDGKILQANNKYRMDFTITKKATDYKYLQIAVSNGNANVTNILTINGNNSSVPNYNKINFNTSRGFYISNLDKSKSYTIILNTVNNYNNIPSSPLTTPKNISFSVPIGGYYRKKSKHIRS